MKVLRVITLVLLLRKDVLVREPESFLAEPFGKINQGEHDWHFPEQAHGGAKSRDGTNAIKSNGRRNGNLEMAR